MLAHDFKFVLCRELGCDLGLNLGSNRLEPMFEPMLERLKEGLKKRFKVKRDLARVLAQVAQKRKQMAEELAEGNAACVQHFLSALPEPISFTPSRQLLPPSLMGCAARNRLSVLRNVVNNSSAFNRQWKVVALIFSAARLPRLLKEICWQFAEVC